jgi:Peptidase family M49
MRIAGALIAAAILMAAVPGLNELKRMSARFAPVELRADTSKLSAGDQQSLAKLVEAAHLVDHIFLQQMWDGNLQLLSELQQDESPLGRARFAYFWLNKGPWSSLDEHQAFLPGVPERKPKGANFYPRDMEKAEFEKWVSTLAPEAREQATGFFSVIRRNGELKAIPYSTEYRGDLERLAALLREAAAATPNPTLKRFLESRASAFLSNDYYDSDVAWMDLDAPIDVTLGPYETYNDELFGYKAAFEAYITIRDDAETEKVKFFSSRLQEIENNLPIDPKYRNPKIGAMAPIRVVHELISSGDAAHGVRTAAFNLPNDERVVREKGSKRVMLKNVQEAKFESILKPIAGRVLSGKALGDLSFDSFFTHILAHELTHGIGPHTVGSSSPRKELKELYSAIEEAKADVCGLFMLQYMLDRKLLPDAGADFERKLYTTFLASSFRTLRFGVNEAHGKGMALQFNYLEDKGAFTQSPDGRFVVDIPKAKTAVRDLAHELLTIEATGDYARANKMMTSLAVLRPNLKSALNGLRDIPTDINPSHVTAAAIANSHPGPQRGSHARIERQ